MTHRLTTNYAKNYCNRTLIVKVIGENVVTCFFGHGVDCIDVAGCSSSRGIKQGGMGKRAFCSFMRQYLENGVADTSKVTIND